MPYRWVVLGFGILAYATSQFARQNYAGVQKFIAADLHLSKGDLGLLGSTFFYAYALFQMPWGIATDKLGSRRMAGLGILLTAAAMAGFATGQSTNALLFWRAVNGVAGAAAYVAMVGGVARWFPPSERGLSQTALGGVGGALGESTAFFLLPVISIYFASGWRQGTNMLAAAIAVIGVLCLIFLRSAPPGHAPTTARPFDWRLLADPRLWCYTFLYSAFIVAIRIVQPWITVYIADVLASAHGLATQKAVVMGGFVTIVSYSVLGRGVGCPIAGRVSDHLLTRGVGRTFVLVGWLLIVMALLGTLIVGVTATWALGLVALGLGISVNLFSLVSAAVAETYRPDRAASVVSFMNMVAQLCGATGLALSGYLGMSLNAQAGNTLTEYRGIWLAAAGGVAILTAIGGGIDYGLGRGWIRPSNVSTEPRTEGGALRIRRGHR